MTSQNTLVPKSKRAPAERAAEHYAVHVHGCVLTRRALRTKFAAVDFFASDVVGKREDGTHVYLQVTTGQASAVTARKRKLEAIPWHPSDTVELLQLTQTRDPTNARRKLWFFTVYEYYGPVREWIKNVDATSIPPEWFTAMRG